MAKETKTEKPTDPSATSYIVRERQKDDTFSETLVVGLESYKKKWKVDHLDREEFYDFVLNPAVQAFGDFGVRIATDEDLEAFGDQVKVAELIKKHTYWDEEQERLKSELRAEIVGWVAENVKTEEQFKSFLANNFLNTNQFHAIARGAKGGNPLPDEFIDMFAAYVSAKSKGTKYERTEDDIRTKFYAKP